MSSSPASGAQVPRRRGEVPDRAARPGPVEIDERDGPAVTEDQVGRVDIVVADQPGAEAGRDRPGPDIPCRVERCRGPVVPAQQVGDAHQRGIKGLVTHTSLARTLLGLA